MSGDAAGHAAHGCRGVSAAATGDLSSFSDAAQVGSYATNAMLWATSNKIITGAAKDGATYLAPLDLATREQIASIMMRYLEA